VEERLWAGQQVMRQELSDFLRQSATDDAYWIVHPQLPLQLWDGNRHVEATPQNYASAMLVGDRYGHEGETHESTMFARRNRINVVVLVENTIVDATPGAPQQVQAGRWIEVYRVLGPEQLANPLDGNDPVGHSDTISVARKSLHLNYS
jgi:hypothetical protein